MTVATFPWPVVAAGAVVLAGILYLLQRLRSRRRVVHLAAAGLWSRAVEEAPLRVLGTRFRYWFAYLLALAIVLTLWLAAAHPSLLMRARAAGPELFYFDGSAVLSGGGEWEAAKRALIADAAAAAPDRREVFLGDATGTRLLAPGESLPLLSQRLDGIGVGAHPSTFPEWLRDRATREMPGERTIVRYYGGWPAARAAGAAVPGKATVALGYLAAPVPGNRGIVALGAMPAASGRWGKADVLVETAAAQGAAPGIDALRFTRDGGVTAAPAATLLAPGRLLLRDVDADGRIIGVALQDGDRFAADDHAAIRLPDWRPIRVALAAGLPAAVRDAVRADEAFVQAAPADAQVIVRYAGGAALPSHDLPALVLAPPGTAPAFRFAGPGEEERGELAHRLDEFGLDRIDAAALADALHRPIGIAVADATVRRITVWQDLFADRSGFVRTATMPLFVSQGLRWLAGQEPWLPYAKAGAVLPGDPFGWSAGATGRRGLPDTPAFAPRADGRGALPVSLVDRATTLAAGDASRRLALSPGGGGALPDPPFTILIAIALLLLAGEWVLVRRGWMR